MNLIEGVQQECNRVRELLPSYEELGPVGAFGLAMLKNEIKEAEAAIASGDVVKLMNAYRRLQECE